MSRVSAKWELWEAGCTSQGFLNLALATEPTAATPSLLVCVCAHVLVYNVWESVLSFYHVCPGDGAQVTRIHSKRFCVTLSRWPGLLSYLSNVSVYTCFGMNVTRLPKAHGLKTWLFPVRESYSDGIIRKWW